MSNINNIIYEWLVDVAGDRKIGNTNKYVPNINKSLKASNALQRLRSTFKNGFNPLASSTTNPNLIKKSENKYKESLYNKPKSKSSLMSRFGNWYKSQFYDNRFK